MRWIFLSYWYEKIELALVHLGLIEQPKDEDSEDMTFEIKVVDIDELKLKLTEMWS